MFKTSCHLHRVRQFEVSNGTARSMLNIMNRGNTICWEDHWFWIELLTNRFLNPSSGLTPFVNSLPRRSRLERKGNVYLNVIISSLDVPTCSNLLASSLDHVSTLVYGNTLDGAHILVSFLYYLFAHDDVHFCIRFVLYRGRSFLGSSIYFCDQTMWVFHTFDLGKPLWMFESMVTPPLVWFYGKIRKQLCLRNFVVSLFHDISHGRILCTLYNVFLLLNTKDS